MDYDLQLAVLRLSYFNIYEHSSFPMIKLILVNDVRSK